MPYSFIFTFIGYDVWMGNTRGNTWSKEHPDLEHCQGCESYWKFSWDDTALKDFPAEIDYILEQTRMLDLFLVGYSMGTSQYFVLLSELPEYNQKIKAGFMMAPVTSVSRCSSLALDLSAYAAAFQTWLHSIGNLNYLVM